MALVIEELPWREYRKIRLTDRRLREGWLAFCWRGNFIVVVGQPAGGGDPMRTSIPLEWHRRRNLAELEKVLREVYGATNADLGPEVYGIDMPRPRKKKWKGNVRPGRFEAGNRGGGPDAL